MNGIYKFEVCLRISVNPIMQVVNTQTIRRSGSDKLNTWKNFMAALIDASDVKRRTLFELDNTPFCCLEAEVNTPTARGGQTLVRLKMRNLLTNAVFEKTFKASDKFKEPDLQSVEASYLYTDSDGSHFLDQESYETLT